MRLARKRQRRQLSITSLIDVIFLLLLFFMLASSFQQFSELEVGGVVANASAQTASDTAPLILQVGETSLTLDGRNVLMGDLLPMLNNRADPNQALSLQVTQDATAQRLTDILVAIEPADGLNVSMGAAQ